MLFLLLFVASSLLDKYENAPDWIRIVLFFGQFMNLCAPHLDARWVTT
jgi:hypothetical protein